MEVPALPPRDSGRYSSAHPSDSEPPASLQGADGGHEHLLGPPRRPGGKRGRQQRGS